MARHAAVASAAVMGSRVFGLLRETLFAALFGASRQYDAFLVAFRIPNLLRDLFAEGALSQAFVKVFAQTTRNQGDAASFALANRVVTLLTLTLGVLSVAGMVFSGVLVDVIAPGFAALPGKSELTATLTTVMFPFIVVVALAAVAMGMLNTRGQFALPQSASTFFNIGSIVAGVGTAWWLAPTYVGDGLWALVQGQRPPPVEDAQAGRAMLGMAVGVLVGGACQLLVQVPALWKLGWRPAVSFTVDERVREVFRLMGPAVLGAAAVQVNVVLVNSNFASHLGDRPISWLNYAFRFMQFPIGLFGVAIASAAAPEFARATADKAAPDLAGLRHAIRQSVALACLLCVPAAVGLSVLGEPLIGLVFEHGRFLPDDTSATAAALGAYAIGLAGYAAIKVLQPALVALDDARTPMWISVGSIAVNLGANHLMVRHLGMGHVGLAGSTSVVALVNALLLAAVLRRRAGGMEGGALVSSLLRITVAAAGMGAVVAGASTLVAGWLPERGMLRFGAQMAVGVPVGALVFGGLAAVLRVPELRVLLGALRRRRAR